MQYSIKYCTSYSTWDAHEISGTFYTTKYFPITSNSHEIVFPSWFHNTSIMLLWKLTYPHQFHNDTVCPTCSVFPVLWSVKWRFSQEEIVVLWLCTKILEYTLLHELFHQIPVFHNTMSYRVLWEEKYFQTTVCCDRRHIYNWEVIVTGSVPGTGYVWITCSISSYGIISIIIMTLHHTWTSHHPI